MNTEPFLPRHELLSFRGNLKATRYGWLRLTPAYSVHLVSEILARSPAKNRRVLDPFCGTGTTALVCAEQGISCDTTDINPFLIWLATAKARAYSADDLMSFEFAAQEVVATLTKKRTKAAWQPPLFQIEKWWDAPTLADLSWVMAAIRGGEAKRTSAVNDLLLVAFCRTMIERANVSFGHQSMSFKKQPVADLFEHHGLSPIAETWWQSTASLKQSAASPVKRAPDVIGCDARQLTARLKRNEYTCVVTSPPYPNRMSYIRELRPYMYWLGFLKDGREAGELDWQAIGGTWGCATSNVGKWEPATATRVPYDGFESILEKIAVRSPLLSRYVHKYFYDMVQHCNELFAVTATGGEIHYIVGNSKFYDVLLPVEEIFAALFQFVGFKEVQIKAIRKRSSKKELFEYVVSATKPSKSKPVVNQLKLMS